MLCNEKQVCMIKDERMSMRKKSRFNTQLRSSYFIWPMLLSLLLVSVNFFLFVLEARQEAELLFNESSLDESLMPAAFQAFILYDEAPLYGVYKVLFPVLSVMPGAFVYIKERQTGAWQYLILRKGKKRYFCSCLLRAFVLPFVLTSAILIFSTVIAHIFLPELGRCDYGYLQKMFEKGKRLPFFMKGLFIRSPFKATLVASVTAGIASALVSILTMSLSFFIKPTEFVQVKLLIPAFVICSVLDIITDLRGRVTGVYLPLHPIELAGISFYPNEREIRWLMLGTLCITILTVVTLRIRSKQDEI